jgi:hypothetical protein
MKTLRYIALLLLLLNAQTMPAQKTSVTIKAQATVIDKAEIELVTIKALDIDAGMAVNGVINVSAKRDGQAGVMLVKGRPDASFRISFTPVVEIQNSAGKGSLTLKYEMYGYSSDNQGASEPIDAAARTLKINSDGKYYFWLGGLIDISKARPGKYEGEFTLEIEYI